MPYPAEANNFLVEHASCLIHSYEQSFKSELIPSAQKSDPFAKQLFYSPFAVVSHNTEIDPVFNYANVTALELFECTWDEFTRLPSRLSAEPVNQAERKRLLTQVSTHGYIKHYEGIRISKSGRRFLIKNARVWNLSDQQGRYMGQAACFEEWQFL
ncbi:MAG: MEKHLA domain-containing protein [Methylococcaceae bacterium]|nr:MEKHLA domain-containing protein [Methylococcaceae bacterium]